MNFSAHKKALSLLVGIFLIASIALTIFLVQQGVLIISRAGPTTVPENIQITNISDTSFTVTFTTSALSPAAIILPDGAIGNTIILDDRDKTKGTQTPYYSHHITVPQLKSQQTYIFTILSDGKEYENPASYMVTTGATIATPPPAQNPLFGTTRLPDGGAGADTIITVKTSESQLASAVTDDTGKFIIPTNSLKNETLTEYLPLTPETELSIEALRQTFRARVNAPFGIAQNLPEITLNQQYAFTPDVSPSPAQPSETFTDIESPSSTGGSTPLVTSPDEGESFIDDRPRFNGRGGANRSVRIEIPNANITTTVETTSQGAWSYRPETGLAQGNYSVTFSIPDGNGRATTITRSFAIFPSGSQITESATPSASPTFTPSPTPTVTTSPQAPTATITTTPTPTGLPDATVTPTTPVDTTPTPTIIPTTPVPTTTPLPPIPPSGSVSSTALLGIVAVILIVSGAAIFFAL